MAYDEELRVYRFDPPNDSREAVLKLGLPFAQRCSPRIQQSSIPTPPPNVPFWPDPEHRVIMITYSFKRSLPSKSSGALLIPYTTFHKLLYPTRTVQDGETSAPRARVEWTQWGASGSVMVQAPPNVRRFSFADSYPYGSQVSFLVPRVGRSNYSPWKRTHLVTFDLNPFGSQFTRNPYIPSRPLRHQWSAERVKVWTGDSTIPHTVSSVDRDEEDRLLWIPKLITHAYGFTEWVRAVVCLQMSHTTDAATLKFTPCHGNLPEGYQEVGFRTHLLNGEYSIGVLRNVGTI